MSINGKQGYYKVIDGWCYHNLIALQYHPKCTDESWCRASGNNLHRAALKGSRL